jgi:redox-sensitive bicupin YhaK (pirin superfamily)
MATANPSATSPRKLGRNVKRAHGSGGFRIEILFPGAALGRGDSGIGTIGRIDHARIMPGTLVSMHPHRDDEILTYLRSGRVEHRDTVGDVEHITPTRLMLMGAGAEYQHEEQVDPLGDTLTALQIFLRPFAEGLAPQVQFHDFGAPVSKGAWRLVAGPDASAPLRVRSRSWVKDVELPAGGSIDLPEEAGKRLTHLLYVFEGAATVGAVALTTGESVLVEPAMQKIVATEQSSLVLFTTDESAPVFKGGMFSGNVL